MYSLMFENLIAFIIDVSIINLGQPLHKIFIFNPEIYLAFICMM